MRRWRSYRRASASCTLSGAGPRSRPEKLLRALLLQVLYTIRSERQLMEQLNYNLLYRWFVGLNMDDPMWDVTVFTKNRERLLKGHIAQAFFQKVLEQARAAKPAVGGALHGGRNLDRSLGRAEGFSTQGQAVTASPRRWQQSDGKLSRPGAPQSDRINPRPIPSRGCIGSPAEASRS